MSPFAGSVARHHRAKWGADPNLMAGRKRLDRCFMQTSTKRFCVKAYMHRGRHDTRPAAEGKRT